MKFATRAFASFALAVVPAAAHANVIYTRQLQSTLYFSNGTAAKPFPDQVQLTFGAGAKALTPAALVSTSILEGSGLSAENVGQSWTSSATTDPDFPSIAAVLTNGAEDNTYVAVEGRNGIGGVDFHRSTTILGEKAFFNTLATTDLAGSELSSITVTLDAFRIDENYAPNPANPADTGWKYFIDYTLSFDAVPEPASLGCLAVLTIPALMRRGRRRQ